MKTFLIIEEEKIKVNKLDELQLKSTTQSIEKK
jgi:hypothetical protein